MFLSNKTFSFLTLMFILIPSTVFAAPCIDTDGDGWGWDGQKSCKISSSTTTAGKCIDTDGDGWGWNGVSSCKMNSSTTSAQSSSNNQDECIDLDGDGWGWDGKNSCKVPSTEITPGKCIDNDGDGWGWNGVSSCKIESAPTTNTTAPIQVPENNPTNDEPDPSAATTTSSINAGEPFPQISIVQKIAWDSGNQVRNRRKPVMGVWEQGDVPGTQIMRISNKSGNGLHIYPSRQAWNVDMSKFMLEQGRVLDATNNYRLLPNRTPLGYDRVWSNTNPSLMYGIQARKSFAVHNVYTNQTTVLYSRGGSEIYMRGKGNLPADDSKVLLYEPSTNTLISFDIKSRRVLGELVWPHGNLNQGGGYLTFDWSGRWIVISMGVDPQGVRRIFRLRPNLTGLTQVDTNAAHSDCAYNSDGESVRITSNGNGSFRITNLDNPNKNYISPVFGGADPQISAGQRYTPCYVSGQGQSRAPAWVVFAGESGTAGSSPNHPIGLYHINGSTSRARVKIIGWDHHSGVNSLSKGENDDKQKPVLSPDGRMVAFTSDWGVPQGELSTYIIRDVSR